MDTTSTLDEIHALIQSDDYVKASARIAEARAAGRVEVLLTLFEALCMYESGDDVETLRLLAEFLPNSTNTKKRPYALFTAAVCLENLGLHEQALELLKKVPRSYPALKKELSHSKLALERQKQALHHFSAIVGSQSADA